MDGLFNFGGMGLPRNLCYWVTTRVDVPRKCLMSVDRKTFPLSKVQVHCVLGIPCEGLTVPLHPVDDDMKSDATTLWNKYSTASPSGTRGINRTKVIEIVTGEVSDGTEFKRAFLMLALNDILCPTTCHRFSASFLPAITVANEASKYDWCSIVLDRLFHAIDNFAKRFYRDGYAKGCGGCTFFLVLFYLDRLNRPPIRLGVFPRVKAWSLEELNKVELEDELPTGDFGLLGTVDAAYGQKHPMEARDVMHEVVSSVADSPLKAPSKRWALRLNPHQYKKRRDEAMMASNGLSMGEDVENETEINPVKENKQYNPKEPENERDNEEEEAENEAEKQPVKEPNNEVDKEAQNEPEKLVEKEFQGEMMMECNSEEPWMSLTIRCMYQTVLQVVSRQQIPLMLCEQFLASLWMSLQMFHL